MIGRLSAASIAATTARVAQAGQYADSQPTNTGYYAGKLTDGQVSPSGTWDWSGVTGWNSEGGPFQVTVNLGESAAVGSVALVTHADQLAGINWPNNVSAATAACPPQDTGITGQSCARPAPPARRPWPRRRSAAAPTPPPTPGRSRCRCRRCPGSTSRSPGTCSGWCLFDEIKVLSPSGSVLSTGATYTVVPTPTNGPGGGTTFGDDDYKLTDGAVVPVYGPQFADAVDGIPGNSGGSVQATWTGTAVLAQPG